MEVGERGGRLSAPRSEGSEEQQKNDALISQTYTVLARVVEKKEVSAAERE